MQELANSTDTCGDDGDNDYDCVRTLTTKDRLLLSSFSSNTVAPTSTVSPTTQAAAFRFRG